MDPNIEKLTANESLSIITAMIQDAKGKVQRNSFFFLLWGWVAAIANIGFYFLIKADVERPYYIWAITIPAWIVTIWKMRQLRNRSRTKSHFDTITMSLWLSFGVIVVTVVFFGQKINYQLGPVILLLTSIPTFLSGIIVRFKPLVMGAVAFWLCGIISFLVPYETQPLVGGIAIIFGYLVPGYMLNSSK